jgi:hypothetical protein
MIQALGIALSLRSIRLARADQPDLIVVVFCVDDQQNSQVRIHAERPEALLAMFRILDGQGM